MDSAARQPCGDRCASRSVRVLALVVCAVTALLFTVLLPGSPAAAASPAPPWPSGIDDGGVRPPQTRAAAGGALGQTPTVGAGTYDVVVVGMTTSQGAPPATALNSAAVIADADTQWAAVTAGTYRLDYRSYVTATYEGRTCDLATMDVAGDTAVRTATGGVPRTGRVGILVVTVMAYDAGCGWAGLGWIGWGSQLNNGYWNSAVVAHEAGHNFNLEHSGALECAGSAPGYPLEQLPEWPCTTNGSAGEYGDNGAVMGRNDFRNRPSSTQRIPANQLQTLGVLGAGTVVDLGSGSGDVVLAPVLPLAGGGTRALRLTVPGSAAGGSAPQTLSFEYRPALPSGPPGGVYLDAFNPGAGSHTWVYRGSHTQSGDASYAMTEGTAITLADGRRVTVVSVGATALLRVQAPGPTAPTISSVTAGVRDLTVAFVAGGDNGSAIANYEYSVDNGATWSARSPQATGSPMTISGLTAATAYTVRIRGVNANGQGRPSAAVTTRTVDVSLPSAPSITSADPGNSSATVNFSPPSSDGGAAVSNYRYSLDNGATWITRSPASTSTPLVIPALTNGTTYQVKLRAVNSSGEGAASSAVAVTPRTVPSAVVTMMVSPGYGAAVVDFAPPFSDGGAPISNYTYSVDDGAHWQTRSPASAASPLVIPGLTNGVTYRVKVRAVNAAGDGAASATYAVTPSDAVPRAPTVLIGTPGDGQASIAFTAPVSDGGAAISNYKYSTDDGATWVTRSPSSPSSPIVITGLTNGTAYQIKLRAVNAAGDGAVSAAVAVTPRTTAGAPTDLVATPGAGQASVAFTAPVSDGGAAISNYKYSTDNGATWVTRSPASVSSPLVITGLTNGTTYQVKLRAVNSAGDGVESAAVAVTPAVAGSLFVPVAPSRVYDSRWAQGGPTSGLVLGRLSGGASRVLSVDSARDGGGAVTGAVVPAGATAVAYNVTVVDTAGAGYLRVSPGDQDGSGSTVNWFGAGQVAANGLVVGVDGSRQVKVTAGGEGSAQVIFDVVGYYVPEQAKVDGGVFTPIAPTRVYDSRTSQGGPGPLGAEGVRNVDIGARASLPAGATAVAYNVTAVNTTGPGYLAVVPADASPNGVSSVNYAPSDVVANGLIVGVAGANKSVTVKSGAAGADFIIDVVGYFTPANGAGGSAGGRFFPIAPTRAYDSRVASPGPQAQLAGEAGGRVVSMIAGRNDAGTVTVPQAVPAGAIAAVFNATVAGTLGGGFLSVAPGDTADPAAMAASTMNWPGSGYIRANGSAVGLDAQRQVKLIAGGPTRTDVIVDTVGYYK